MKNFSCGFFWISFASDVLRWWLENLLRPSIWVFVVRSIFCGNIVFSTGGRLQLGCFGRSSSIHIDWLHLYQGVFISIIVIYDFILLFFCSIWSSFLTTQIWYGWCLLCRRGRIGFLGQIVLQRSFLKSSQIDQDNTDHHHQGIYKVFQVRPTGWCLFSRSQSIGIFIFMLKP